MSILNTDTPKPRNAMVGVVKVGYLKKNKSMRKKFFVLREETVNGGPARLEYYDSEKKWRNNAPPKKVIVLKTCFKIDKRVDSRTKRTSIRLYTSEKFFYLLFDSERELDEWLDLMLVLQRVTKEFGPSDSVKEPFEHIWHISILKKELGLNPKLMGMTGLCLCDKKVTVMKYPTKSKEKQDTIDIMLSSVRRCGALGTLFYMEVGQSSPFGVGHIWMDTWNSEVAKSVHDSIMSACASSRNHDPRFRMRSSSFNEGSRLMNCSTRQRSSVYDENNPGLRYKNNSQSSSTLNNGNIDLARAGSVRERCDSMPLRPRTISENTTSTRSFHGILSPKQTFHKGCNCVSALSSVAAFYDSGLTSYNSSLSRSTDITDGLSSLYMSLNDQRSAILEEKQQDFVSYTPLDREEDLLRQTIDSNVNNNINLINNNFIGNRSSSSSQTGSCCDSNSPYGSPINVDDHAYVPLHPSVSETLPPPDGYLPMKPGYTFCNYVSMEAQNNSKQDSINIPQTEFNLPEGYVPMAPRGRFSDYVSMDCNKRSVESGTPSTDTRFSDIHLEKVCAYLTPSECKGTIVRPTRAYSVGSRPDGLREKIDRIYADRSRTRAFSVGSRGRLPPSGLGRSGYQSGSTSMSEQSDSGDRMEIDFSCNSKSRRLYSATCRTLSVQTPAELSPRSSPKLCSTPDVSCSHKSTGRSPPKSIVSSVDVKRTLSGAVHGISRSPPTSAHSYLSPTLERVSEVPSVEHNDNYTAMKPGQGLFPGENPNLALEDSNKKNYVNVWEAASSTLKMIGGLHWKKNKKRSSTPVQEQPTSTADEGVDETDNYTTIKPGDYKISTQSGQEIGQSKDPMLDALRDGVANLVFDPSIAIYKPQTHSQSDNPVSSLDG